MNLNELIRQLNRLQQRVDSLIKPEVSRWADWTPTVTQSGAVTVTVTEAQYKTNEDDVRIYAQLAVTGTGTAGNNIVIAGWPAALDPTPGAVFWPVGVGVIVDTGTQAYEGVAAIVSTNAVAVFNPTSSGFIGASPSFALANGDFIFLNMQWKRA